MDAAHPLERLCAEAHADPEGFWRAVADQHVTWFRKPDRIFVSEAPTFSWFAGGRMNLCWNAVDRQSRGPGDRGVE